MCRSPSKYLTCSINLFDAPGSPFSRSFLPERRHPCESWPTGSRLAGEQLLHTPRGGGHRGCREEKQAQGRAPGLSGTQLARSASTSSSLWLSRIGV